MQPQQLVSIIVVTHNSFDFVETCLDSIRRATIHPSYEVLIVDNASNDETRQELEKYAYLDERIRLIPLTDNQNFAAANNIGVLHSQGSYFVFLNVDTVVTSGWLRKLLGHVQRDTSIGAVLPVTNWAGNEARIEVPYNDLYEMENFAALLAERKRGETFEISVAPLFCALIPRYVWSKVGQLDMRFEVGMFEDDDYSHRIKQHGLRIVCAEDCFVHHFGRASFKKMSADQYRRIFETNRERFEKKWGRAWAPHSYRQGVSSEPREFHPEHFFLNACARKLAEKDRRIAQASRELLENRRRFAEELVESEHRFTQELVEGERRLRRAEGLVRQFAAALEVFENEFRSTLQTYKTQRAWTAMLMIRKAYSVFIGKKFRDALSLGKWMIKPPNASDEELQAFDLEFPAVQDYLPVELKAEMETIGATAGWTAGSQKKYDLVVLPVFEFDFRFQRPQQLARQFARHGHRVFWVSPTRAVPSTERQLFQLVGLGQNLWEVRLRANCPNMFLETLSRERVHEILESLSRMYVNCAISESCVLLQLPFWRAVAVGLRNRFGARVAYDCMDDWENMPNVSEFNCAEEDKLVQECDVLLASAKSLVEKHSHLARKPILVRNGADFDLFSAGEPNDKLDDVKGPIVGYFGSIAEWFDYELLFQVAKSRPDYSFVLIGGYGLEKEVASEETAFLRGLPNVHFLGHKNYSELPAYLADFDACIIPFVVNALTSATDPVKVYEYFSQGKPVVSTPLQELTPWRDLVYIAERPEEFAGCLDSALTESNKELRERRRLTAANNTWDHRFTSVEKAIKESFPPIFIIIDGCGDQAGVKKCIDSIQRNTSYPSYDVLVVHGEPESGTLTLPANHLGLDGIGVIESPDSQDWHCISRAALQRSPAEFWVLLSTNIEVTPGWLGRLLQHCGRDGLSIGAVVPVSNWPASKTRMPLADTSEAQIEALATALGSRRMLQHLRIESTDIRIPGPGCVLVRRDVLARIGELECNDDRRGSGCDVVLKSVRELGLPILCAEDCFVYDDRTAG